MRLSTQMRYGVRALAELALVYPDGVLSLREMAVRQELSLKYTALIMAGLRSAGIVRTVRGTHGGYELARAPASITLAEVYEVLEGGLAIVDCVAAPESCRMHGVCPARETWVEVSKAVQDVLSRTTLQDLAGRLEHKASDVALTYQI